MRPISELAARNQPDALEVQVGLGTKEIEVAVVVQDAEAVPIGDRGEDEVNRGQSVVSGESQLTLRVDRAIFDPLIDRDKRESKQLFNQLVVIGGASGRVSGLKQKRQAGRNASAFESNGDLLRAGIRKRDIAQSCPRGIVEQEFDAH